MAFIGKMGINLSFIGDYMDILTKFKNLTVEALRDNKKLIIGLYILFIVCAAVAWILSAARVESVVGSMPSANTTATTGIQLVGATELFINNEWGGIETYIFSIFFAIPAFVMLIYNAINLGALGQLFAQLVPNGGLKYIVYLIPHGIFEITATVVQSAAGVLLFLFILRFIKAWRSSREASEAFEQTKKILIQSIMLMIFATILLLIAAPIEAYVSVPLSELIVGS